MSDYRRIIVTGGSGKAGRWVVRGLAGAGYEVRNVDLVPSVAQISEPPARRHESSRARLLPHPNPLPPGEGVRGSPRPPGEGARVPFLRADLTDYGQAVDALKGADAVVHLAAIPAPGLATDEVTFRTNVTSTYNVFQAAATLGLKRVVWASSETVLGLPFDKVRPDYAPIDEACTRYPQTAYALSKLVGEELAKQYARWSAHSSTPLPPSPLPLRERARVRGRRGSPSPRIKSGAGSQSSPAGRGGTAGIPFIGLRFSNVIEPGDYARFAGWQDDAKARAWNFWGYVDARDCAQACQRALEAGTAGWADAGPQDSGSNGLAQVFIIAATDTAMRRPNSALLRDVYPAVLIRGRLTRNGTLLSIEKARRMLGYEPEHSWRTEPTRSS